MSAKADEIIKLRNEGMAYALKIAQEDGIEGLERQVKLRNLLKVSIKFTADEIDQSIDSISDRVYNNMLTITYAVLHDAFGYGEKRLMRFKEMFDRKTFFVGDFDPKGRHYARFETYAEEANKLYNLGIDMDKVKESQGFNDLSQRSYVAQDLIIKILEEKGFTEALEAVQKEMNPRPARQSKKQRQRNESRQESDRHNRFYIDDTYELNIEYWFNVFGLAMAKNGIDTEKLVSIWKEVDKLDASIADGKQTLEQVKDKLLDAAGIVCEFTKAEDVVVNQ